MRVIISILPTLHVSLITNDTGAVVLAPDGSVRTHALLPRDSVEELGGICGMLHLRARQGSCNIIFLEHRWLKSKTVQKSISLGLVKWGEFY
jgi:hypothetical protein